MGRHRDRPSQKNEHREKILGSVHKYLRISDLCKELGKVRVWPARRSGPLTSLDCSMLLRSYYRPANSSVNSFPSFNRMPLKTRSIA